MRETEIFRDGRVMRVRDAGDPDGAVVMYFHGTPSSRLDLCFGDTIAAGRGVRLVSFDRPGYGGSAAAPFGLVAQHPTPGKFPVRRGRRRDLHANRPQALIDPS